MVPPLAYGLCSNLYPALKLRASMRYSPPNLKVETVLNLSEIKSFSEAKLGSDPGLNSAFDIS